MIVIENKFDIGQVVYLKTDTDQLPRIVTAIKVCGDNSFFYELSCGRDAWEHYDFEISEDINQSIKAL